LQQVWLSASNPTFSIHCKHLKSTCLVGRKEKNLPVAWLNHPKPVQLCQDRCINGLDQEKPVIPTQKAYWTRTMSCGQPFRDYSNMKLLVFNWSKVNCLFRLSFHVVGKRVCLVMLWQNPARRDKPWNYIPTEFQRYTKLILATGNLYGHVENVWGIPFSKRKKEKYHLLSELFQE
jgi:hypothetical protein